MEKMADLPSIAAILQGPSHPDSPLAVALSILFEPSPILLSTLEPQLASVLSDTDTEDSISSYSQLIHEAMVKISEWDKSLRLKFIAGHPRIGESKNLSNLSAKEQGAETTSTATPREVLARLAHLNACYEQRYPGLRYITFVNGRSRAAIVEEMEVVLNVKHSLSSDEPPVESFEPVEVEGREWSAELDRAIEDVRKIALSRVAVLLDRQ
jgi:2-oxo-4-hydroxy-4-carboxy--5-ureidoimidazoline (OHCU) decarboxylase